MTDEQELYSASDLARAAKVTPGYVARLCRNGTIPARKFGSTWLIRAEDAEKWLRERSEGHNG